MKNVLITVSVILPTSVVGEGFDEAWRLGGFSHARVGVV